MVAMSKLFIVYLSISLITVMQGCALHFYDPETGVEHIWGITHAKMKIHAPPSGTIAVAKQIDTLGLGIGVGAENYYLMAGIDVRRSITILDPNTCVRLAWPTSNLFEVRVGSHYPPAVQNEGGAEALRRNNSCAP